MFASLVFSTFAVEFVRQLVVVLGDLGENNKVEKSTFCKIWKCLRRPEGVGIFMLKAKRSTTPLSWNSPMICEPKLLQQTKVISLIENLAMRRCHFFRFKVWPTCEKWLKFGWYLQIVVKCSVNIFFQFLLKENILTLPLRPFLSNCFAMTRISKHFLVMIDPQ